jgi:phosphatidylglycerol:prolipoprotein diacylglycerol transferase
VHPEIVNIGPLHLRSYGLMMALAFLVATWMLARAARKRGIDPDAMISLGMVALVSGVAGGRLMYVLGHPHEFQGKWHEALYLWQGGLTLWGGFLLAVPASLWYLHKKRLPVWTVADLGAVPLAIGAAIGRLGCFLNGCCYGVPATVPWAVRFPEKSLPAAQFGDAALHPSQLYNVGVGLVAAGLTVLIAPRLRAPGQRFWFLFGTYGILRALVDLTRYYEPSAILAHVGRMAITESQVIGAAIAIVSAILFTVLGERHRRATASPAAGVPAPGDPPTATAPPATS